jgi:hypothetical protein
MRLYERFQVPPEQVEQIQAAVRQELTGQQVEAARVLQRASKRKSRLQDERQKLLLAAEHCERAYLSAANSSGGRLIRVLCAIAD